MTINLEGLTDAGGASRETLLSAAAGATNDLESVTINSTTVANSIETLNVGGVDTATLVITGDQDLTIADALDTDITTVNAGDFTGALTATLSATATTLTSGSGADNITIGSATDSVTTGAGADTINVATANLTAATTIAGGSGSDTLSMTDNSTVVDADFTLVTGVETLTAAAGQTLSATLGALADAAGVRTVTLADTGGNDSLTVGAGFTSDLSVNLDGDTTNVNSVVATAYTGALTVTGLVSELDDGASTVTGGTGTSDTLAIVVDETDDAVLTNVSNVETVTVTDGDADNDHTTNVTLVDGNATYTSATNYQTITVDVSAIGASGDTVNVNASAEADAKVVVTGGAGVNNITLSGSANFGDTVDAGAGNDTITTATANLTAADTIDGGAGTDTIVTSDDATVVDADFTNVTNVEAISGTANQDLDLTLGALQSAGIRTVTFTDEASAGDTVTIGAGYTSAVTIVLDDSNAAGKWLMRRPTSVQA